MGGWVGNPSSSFSHSIAPVLEAGIVLEMWDRVISPYSNLTSLGQINRPGLKVVAGS